MVLESTAVAGTSLEIGFLLDRQWHLMRGEPERSKRSALLALAKVFADTAVPYAVIDGVALQVHQREPRTTLDIDLAVRERRSIPRDALIVAGFRETGSHAHSDNWIRPEGTPVQFTDDPALADAIERAVAIDLEGTPLRVLARGDLLHEKLRAGRDPARRRSKRLQDLVDAQALLEAEPALAAELTADERAQLDRLPR